MAKLTLVDITSLANAGSAKTTLNNNFAAIEAAFENTLSRDGTGPNAMSADMDLGDHRLLNVADPSSDADGVNLRSVRVLVNQFAGEIAETIVMGTARVKHFTATDGQQDFPLDSSPGVTDNMEVYDNGIQMDSSTEYTLTGSDLKTLHFTTGRVADARITVRYIELAPADGIMRSDLANTLSTKGAALVSYTPPSSAAGTVKSWLDTLFGNTGLNLLKYLQNEVNGVVRTLASKLRDRVTPEDFGAVGDGVANDTAAMNAAITHLNGIGWSKPLHLSGTYKLTSAPTIITAVRSPTIIGNGARILLEYTTGDGIVFYSGSGGPQIQNPRVVGVEFDSTTVTRASGAAVRGLNVADMRVDSCTFYNQYTGVKFSVYQYPTIINSSFLSCVDGVEFDIGSGGTITGCRMQTGSGTTPTPGTVGVRLTNASGVMISNTDIVRYEVGIYGRPAAGAAVQFLFLVNTLLDTGTYGLQLSTAGGGTVSSIFATNSWFSSNVENGVYASGVKNLRLTACELIVNKRDGVNLISCEEVRIQGGMIGWNNTLNAASGGGVAATGVAGLSIRNVLFTNKSGWLSYGATSNQNYAVVLSGAASSNVEIIGNMMVDHSTGDIAALTTPTGSSRVNGNRTSRSSSIASAVNITIEPTHDEVSVTGTTTIQNAGLPAFSNHIVRLRIIDGCTIQDGFNFKLAGNFVGTVNSVLTLMAVPGTGWVEVARSIN